MTMRLRIRVQLLALNWELFDHSPYSPDLAPSDYLLFAYLKKLVAITAL
jgi:hypothetical protein